MLQETNPINSNDSNDGFPKITIVKFKPCVSGCLCGFFSVKVAPGLVIHDCKLFMREKERWVRLPDREFTKRDGSKGYAPIVEIAARDLQPQFQQAVLAAFDRHIQENSDVG
jgi:DNA-binding cell septation regulator SpoVG